MALLTILAMVAAWERGAVIDLWISLGTGLLGIILFCAALIVRQRGNHWALEKNVCRYDRQSQDPILGGSRLSELYGDRAVMLSAREQVTIFYRDAALLLETNELMLLADRENRWMIWMAEDLTPFDADTLRRLLYASVPDRFRRIKGRLLPRLSGPLPLPVFRGSEPVEQAVDLTGRILKRPLFGAAMRRRLLTSLPLLFPVAAASVSYAGFTPSYPLDIAIAFLLWTALLLLAGGIFTAISNRRFVRGTEPVRIAFTGTGIAVNWHGATLFTPWEETRPRFRKDMVQLESDFGTLTIPLRAAQDSGAFCELIRRHTNEDRTKP